MDVYSEVRIHMLSSFVFCVREREAEGEWTTHLASVGCYRELAWSTELALKLIVTCQSKSLLGGGSNREEPLTEWHWKIFRFLTIPRVKNSSRYAKSCLCYGSRPVKLNSLHSMPSAVSFVPDCAKWTTDCVNKMWPCLLQSVPPWFP